MANVVCGWCGEQLDSLGSDHCCLIGMRVASAIQTNSPEPILNNDDE